MHVKTVFSFFDLERARTRARMHKMLEKTIETVIAMICPEEGDGRWNGLGADPCGSATADSGRIAACNEGGGEYGAKPSNVVSVFVSAPEVSGLTAVCSG
jgi:hypothetical protein